MVEYDLHIHSTASDGLLNLEEIFKIAYMKRLKGISITDHDTVSSLSQGKRLGFEFGIDFIPGIELSTVYKNKEVHILGYYIDYTDENFNAFLNTLQRSRYDRASKMVKKISDLGYEISFDEVLKTAGENYNSIGRPHIAQVLINKGYFKDIPEVFDKLIGSGKPAYVQKYKVSTFEGIKKILDAGGIPVLAHPMLIEDLDKYGIEKMIKKLKEHGLLGIEVFHTKQSIEDSYWLCSIAERYDLTITGGSDCHGRDRNINYLLGSKGVSTDKVVELKNLRR